MWSTFVSLACLLWHFWKEEMRILWGWPHCRCSGASGVPHRSASSPQCGCSHFWHQNAGGDYCWFLPPAPIHWRTFLPPALVAANQFTTTLHQRGCFHWCHLWCHAWEQLLPLVCCSYKVLQENHISEPSSEECFHLGQQLIAWWSQTVIEWDLSDALRGEHTAWDLELVYRLCYTKKGLQLKALSLSNFEEWMQGVKMRLTTCSEQQFGFCLFCALVPLWGSEPRREVLTPIIVQLHRANACPRTSS